MRDSSMMGEEEAEEEAGLERSFRMSAEAGWWKRRV